MNIDLQRMGSATVLRLQGRLDVAWAGHVEARAQELLRSGRHVLLVDASGLTYLSSAGIRTLLQLRREVAAVQGAFFVANPSEFVGQALRMSGLETLIASDAQLAGWAGEDEGGVRDGGGTEFLGWKGMAATCHRLAGGGAMALRAPSRWTPWAPVSEAATGVVALPVGTVALGIGAAGRGWADARERFGEFLAAAGCMAWQPADARQHVPDFVTQEGSFVPEILAIQTLVAEGAFPLLLRFGPEGETGSVAFADLAAGVLRASGTDRAVFVALGETDGLVGMALARSPGRMAAGEDPGRFPDVRDWVNFCGERVHAGRTALVAGFVARKGAGGLLEELLAPLPSAPQICAHAHAAVFPFRPLPDGPLEMEAAVRALFDAREPLDLLHLAEDDRPLTGLGDSAFVRGACWCASLRADAGGAP